MQYRDRVINLLSKNEKLFASVISRFRNFEDSIFKAEVKFPWNAKLWDRFVKKKSIKDFTELNNIDFPNKYSELLYSFDVEYSKRNIGVNHKKRNIKFERLSIPFSDKHFGGLDLSKIGENRRLSNELINRNHDKFDKSAWESISKSEYLDWNLKFIKRHFQNLSLGNLLNNSSIYWDVDKLSNYLKSYSDHDLNRNYFFEILSQSKTIGSSEELIKWFSSELNWPLLSKNPSIKFNRELLNEYKNMWVWSNFFLNDHFPWSFPILKEFKSSIEWEKAPYVDYFISPNLYWTAEKINDFDDVIDYSSLGLSENVEFSEFILNKIFEISGYNISYNHGVAWSKNLIQKYENNWDWEGLLSNKSIHWDKDLLNHFENYIEWNGKIVYRARAKHLYKPPPILKNPNVEIDVDILKQKAIDWKTGEVYIRFSESPEQYGEWHYYSSNKYITPEIIDVYTDKLDWPVLIKNELMNWDLSILEKHANKLNNAGTNLWFHAIYNDKLWKDVFDGIIDEDIISRVYKLIHD